jgi:hypothetical protein
MRTRLVLHWHLGDKTLCGTYAGARTAERCKVNCGRCLAVFARRDKRTAIAPHAYRVAP